MVDHAMYREGLKGSENSPHFLEKINQTVFWDLGTCTYDPEILWPRLRSVPLRQNTFLSRLVKNELRVFSESLGPPPSSTYPFMAIAGLQRPEKCVFVNAFPSHFHQLQFVKTCSHRQNAFPSLLVGIEFVKTRSRRIGSYWAMGTRFDKLYSD